MSLGCAISCGKCCDPVELGPGVWASFVFWAPGGMWESMPDPAVDWEPWAEIWGEESQESIVEMYTNPDNEVRRNAIFAAGYWHPRAEPLGRLLMGQLLGLNTVTKVDCDAFDPVHRVCTAHDGRPPICSGFPWYHYDPKDSVASGERPLPYPRAVPTFDGGAALSCSYVVDLPPDMRRGIRPQIPLTVL